ncbi:efflux RND transporter periplasmic adaptor subunit [Parahaliea aestuarii]|uniref:Efflux RND transporter periplasmic adaptor subunit n=1 Tax=Parahaliea aestuarii TaxID=1852021 RepID=A0A5C8ZXJ8_9GAMM|nr:efflux RND transporter periplasmic adaptor subunit [Parahaliea aestuarii]TXS93196.1 efflux RND transporter periplasmic adaptor subunit [Parahaliea aestuarii]
MPSFPTAANLPKTLIGIAVALALAIGLSSLLKWRADAAVSRQHADPLPVATTVFRLQDSYSEERRFLGVTEAPRRADLGFESAGQLASMPVHEGSVVRAGDILAQLDDRLLQSRRKAAAAELETLQADLELARLKAQRQQDLQASGAVSREAFDETRLRAQALAAQRKAVSAQLEQLDIELEKMALRAPYDGIVAALYIDTGAVVAPGTRILRLIQGGAREAHIGVTPELAATLAPGQAYPLRWRGDVLQGTLRSVRPDLDPVSRAAVAVFELPPEQAALDGEAITLLLQRDIAQRGGWLPVSALLEGQRGVWNVLAVNQHEQTWRTEREVVEVLELRGDRAFVRGTLADGQAVVAEGLHRIAAGSAVTPLER